AECDKTNAYQGFTLEVRYGQTDVALTAAVSPSPVEAGQSSSVSWAITVANNGLLPASGTVSVTLPAATGYTLDSTVGTNCTGSGTARSCAFSGLAAGTSGTITVT